LGATGLNSQQTRELVSSDRSNDLFEALLGDRGAHGNFGDRSYKQSIQTSIAENRLSLAVASSLLIGTTIRDRRN
jgi:hypothetical protein